MVWMLKQRRMAVVNTWNSTPPPDGRCAIIANRRDC